MAASSFVLLCLWFEMVQDQQFPSSYSDHARHAHDPFPGPLISHIRDVKKLNLQP